MSVEFGDAIDRQLVSAVAAMESRLTDEIAAGLLDGVIETVPTYRSLTVFFEPLKISRATLQNHLSSLLQGGPENSGKQSRHWHLPVCYGGGFGLDLDAVAGCRGITPAEVVALHGSQTYLVYMIGFLPGFPFMGDVVPDLHMPRRTEPRIRVPAGSVAIAGQQTAIYPWESPGGWHILGRCPLRLFDAHRDSPALLCPGDRVTFASVSLDHYRELLELEGKGLLDIARFLQGGSTPCSHD